jgi:hypothetical protein
VGVGVCMFLYAVLACCFLHYVATTRGKDGVEESGVWRVGTGETGIGFP